MPLQRANMKLEPSVRKNRNGSVKPTTNVEKKTKKKIESMTANDSLTMEFVLKNRKLLKHLKNCKVKLPKNIKSNQIKKRTKVQARLKVRPKPTKEQKTEKSPSLSPSSVSKKSPKSPKSQKATEQPKKGSPQSTGPIFIRLPAHRSIRKTNKRQAKTPGKTQLVDEFGQKVFRSHVRVKRLKKADPLFTKKLNINRKTVSFMETVEIFGESDIEYETDESGELDMTSSGSNKKAPRTSTPIIGLFQRKKSPAQKDVDEESDKPVRQSRRLSTCVRIEIDDNSNESGEHDEGKDDKETADSNHIETTEDQTEQKTDGNNCPDISENSNDSDNMKTKDDEMNQDDQKNQDDIEDSETEGNAMSPKEDRITDEKEDKLEEDVTDNVTTEKPKDIENLYSNVQNSASKINGKEIDSPTESFHSASENDSSQTQSPKDNATSKHEKKKGTKLEKTKLNTSTQNQTTIKSISTKNNRRLSDPLTNPATSTTTSSTENLFDLLKSNKLPPTESQRQSLSRSLDEAPEFSEDDDDEDEENTAKTLQAQNLSTIDDSTELNDDSRFSLNTFFKSIKEKIIPNRSRNSLDSSKASELNLSNAEQKKNSSPSLFDETRNSTGTEITTQ